MMRRERAPGCRTATAILVTALLAPAAAAQDSMLADPDARDPARDPTRAAPALRELLELGAATSPDSTRATLPALRLLARVLIPGTRPAAILEVDGARHHVREGSTVTLPGAGRDPVVIEVAVIDRDGVQVIVTPSGQSLLLQ